MAVASLFLLVGISTNAEAVPITSDSLINPDLRLNNNIPSEIETNEILTITTDSDSCSGATVEFQASVAAGVSLPFTVHWACMGEHISDTNGAIIGPFEAGGPGGTVSNDFADEGIISYGTPFSGPMSEPEPSSIWLFISAIIILCCFVIPRVRTTKSDA